MTSAFGTPGSIEATTALLQAELPRLEAHQQILEKDLATVTERLESVRTALSALHGLSLAPYVAEPAVSADDASAAAPSASGGAAAATVPEAEPTAEQTSPTEQTPAPARRKSRKAGPDTNRATGASRKGKTDEPKEQKHRPVKGGAAKESAPAVQDKAVEDKHPSGLTEQVVEILSKAGDAPVRARDVAQALGRDDTPGSINAVRSTLDRLVATSRAHRAGRGLYQSPGN
ncbi:hypothetical protein ACFVWZ_26825 [Streptomyces sp. NPDC058200]|uniref:hypothetical protein n=1 Tax=Streptomyces sp. NPDC058200 TaxID=3346378 RepID=UPI0036E859E1